MNMQSDWAQEAWQKTVAKVARTSKRIGDWLPACECARRVQAGACLLVDGRLLAGDALAPVS